MDLLWTLPMLLPSSGWGGRPATPTYSLMKRKTLSGKGTVGGAYPLLSSCHIPLPSPFQYWKRNLGSE